jgi:uncharacterized membrane-anchored protein YhcB (DUF1043 family)
MAGFGRVFLLAKELQIMATTPINREGDWKTKTQEGASALADKAKQTADTATDKAKDFAHNVADKAKDAAGTVAEKAKDAAATLGHKAEDATQAVGSGIESLGGRLRDKLPEKGVLGAAGSSVASGLESSGKYIREEGLSGMADDVTNMIRRNPLPAVLVGVALGFMIARLTTRS